MAFLHLFIHIFSKLFFLQYGLLAIFLLPQNSDNTSPQQISDITLIVSVMESTFLVTVGAPADLSRRIQPADMALLKPTFPALPANFKINYRNKCV
jgi:hypothetical protein